MRGTKLSYYDVGLLITCLHQMKKNYNQESIDSINEILLSLLDIQDSIKPGKKKRISFDAEDVHLMRYCLVDWRNQFLREEKLGAADAIAEVLFKLV